MYVCMCDLHVTLDVKSVGMHAQPASMIANRLPVVITLVLAS